LLASLFISSLEMFLNELALIDSVVCLCLAFNLYTPCHSIDFQNICFKKPRLVFWICCSQNALCGTLYLVIEDFFLKSLMQVETNNKLKKMLIEGEA
jgi:hypothetical protein